MEYCSKKFTSVPWQFPDKRKFHFAVRCRAAVVINPTVSSSVACLPNQQNGIGYLTARSEIAAL